MAIAPHAISPQKMRSLPPILLLVFTAAACSLPGEQGHYQSVGPDGWLYGDTVSHRIVLTDTTVTAATGSIAMAVRHTDAYEYSNIWVELTYHTPESLRRDTFNVALADDYGRWLGTGVGVGFQKVDTLLRGVQIDPAYMLSVRHIMRADTLPDIEQIGLIFVP